MPVARALDEPGEREKLRAALPQRYDTWTVTEDVDAVPLEFECGIRRWPELDTRTRPKGVTATDASMEALSLHRHEFHGDWSYELHPR